MTKVCSRCKIEKPTTEFNKWSRAKDGLWLYCRDCKKLMSRNERQRNKGTYQAAKKRYIERHYEHHLRNQRQAVRKSREKRKEADQAYREQNREKIRQISREWYRTNKERKLNKSKEYYENHKYQRYVTSRQWRADNPDRVSSYHRTRRARLRGALCTLTEEQITEVMQSFGGVCFYCKSRPATDLDHVLALTKGGDHIRENVVPSCRSCNSSKGSKTLEEWRRAL